GLAAFRQRPSRRLARLAGRLRRAGAWGSGLRPLPPLEGDADRVRRENREQRVIPRDGEQLTRSGGWASAVALAMLGFGCVLIPLGDPGFTLVETIIIGPGVQMVSLLLHSPGELLDYPRGKPGHPPLTRFLIGASHRL